MRRTIRLVAAVVGVLSVEGWAQPQPRVVDPGGPGKAPSDAVVFFDGRDLSQWETRDGGPSGCAVADGAMTCKTGAGDIFSKTKFRDAQIHLEFAPPYMPENKDQSRGNSGVYLHGRYEIQVLDSYNNPTYPNGSCAAIYGQAAPMVNASRPPEQWQSYDIIFHGARCDSGGNLVQKPRVTMLHNGVLVHDNVEIRNLGKGCAAGIGEPGPLMLQDHNYKGAPVTLMKFRNIWVRILE
jgi:hypothetical protein